PQLLPVIHAIPQTTPAAPASPQQTPEPAGRPAADRPARYFRLSLAGAGPAAGCLGRPRGLAGRPPVLFAAGRLPVPIPGRGAGIPGSVGRWSPAGAGRAGSAGRRDPVAGMASEEQLVG